MIKSINKTVNHVKFGRGSVISINGPQIIVEFDVFGKKVLAYPDVFEALMQYDDVDMQCVARNDLADKRFAKQLAVKKTAGSISYAKERHAWESECTKSVSKALANRDLTDKYEYVKKALQKFGLKRILAKDFFSAHYSYVNIIRRVSCTESDSEILDYFIPALIEDRSALTKIIDDINNETRKFFTSKAGREEFTKYLLHTPDNVITGSLRSLHGKCKQKGVTAAA